MAPNIPKPYIDTLAAHRRRLARIIDRRGVVPMKTLYNRAQAEIVNKLTKLGPASQKFAAHQHRMVLGQLRQGSAMVAKRMRGEMSDLSLHAQTEALRGLSQDVTKLEKFYTDADIVLPIDEAARFQGVINGRRDSLLRAHDESIAEWSVGTVRKMENELSLSLLEGENFGEAVTRIEGVADAEWWQAERIVRTECLSGDTLVSGAVVRAAHRRFYEGPMVEVITRGGRKFSATPNHPMLTRRGWVAAGQLDESDYLVCYLGDQHAGAPGNENVAAPPATIAEVFDAVSAVGVRERRRTAKPDFHGDGLDGHVDIECADRMLGVGCFAPVHEPLGHYIFSPTYLMRPAFCAHCGELLLVTRRCGVCDSPVAHPGFFKSLLHDAVAYAQCFGYTMGALIRLVSFRDVINGQVIVLPWMPAPASIERKACVRQASGHPSVFDNLPNPYHAKTCSRRHLGDAKAGDIQFDGVAAVRVFSFSGHVYNLTTPHGYFAINNIYTGNTAYAFNATHADGIVECAEELPDMMMRWTEYVDDITGRGLDDRVAPDSLIMHGQVAAPGGTFFLPTTMPDGMPIPEDIEKRIKHMRTGMDAGRWSCPPNRPNDRSVLAPWRPHWGIPAWRWENGMRVDVP